MEGPRTAAEFAAIGAGTLPGLIGMEVLSVDGGRVTSRLAVRPELMAPIGYLHAVTVVALADTTAGFTTLELKTNFLGTARAGAVACEETLVHGGRSTQVWDAMVTAKGSGKPIALFRCTPLILYPRPK